MKVCFGVDVGGSSVKMGLINVDGEILEKWDIRTRTENEGFNILPDISASIEKKIKERGLNKDEIIGIGTGVPAPVNDAGVVFDTANLGWKYKEVKRELEERTGLRTKVGNDANVAALGEMWKGSGEGHKDLVVVTLGTGVGGGIIVDGKSLTGANGAGGEIGHVKVNFKERFPCGCGSYGCLEQYASAKGIARLARRRLKKERKKTILNKNRVSAKTVFDGVNLGDEVAIEIAQDFGEYMARGLASIATTVDPSAFVIGGGVSKAGDVLFDFIKEPYQKYSFFANKKVEFVCASLGNDAGMIGAAKLLFIE